MGDDGHGQVDEDGDQQVEGQGGCADVACRHGFLPHGSIRNERGKQHASDQGEAEHLEQDREGAAVQTAPALESNDALRHADHARGDRADLGWLGAVEQEAAGIAQATSRRRS